ncbi:cadherin-23-like isoform X1 [Mizuhopecten yessoensis]|uniref:cadherin-23-like isoform X1 n=1 Tax=Mizuhopecten yessoensis TaxID=6573 RepID=UPI000B45CFB7|nr:cadherin-23-like isoform X1 [Mizuhopecten yessoensis]
MVFTVLLLMSAAFLAPVIGQEIKFLEQQTSGIDGNLKVALTNGILENTQRGTYIGQLVAYVDGQSNSNIVYSKEIGGDNYLDVSPTGEVTTDAPLDRELSNANTILITFIATFETVETRAPIKISVLDKNDNIPIFERTEGLAVEVSEDVANGTMVFSNIFVSDLDLGWYAQIKMTCMVVPNDTKSAEACDTFGLSETPVNDPQNPDLKAQGFIYVKKALDYETQKEYTMTISAVDNPDKKGGGVSHPVTVNIAIDVFDEQDSPPVFSTNTLRAFVHEHSMVGKRLSSVTVRDGDRGNPRLLNISIIDVSGNSADLFDLSITMDAATRVYTVVIVVKGDIDRETYPAGHSFIIKAIEIDDTTGLLTNSMAEVTVEVTIEDINDNPPIFTKNTYNVNLTEPIANDGIVPGVTIEVSDADVTRTADGLSYSTFNVSIISQSSPPAFHLNNDGGTRKASFNLVIDNYMNLDYEVPAYRTRVVVIEAVDFNNNSLSSTAVVNINIIDYNDNAPVFLQTSYSASVSENELPGKTVQTIRATDSDSGTNAALTYTFVDPNIVMFNLNPTTGVVTLAQQLDYDNGAVQYEMTVIVSDGGNPTETASTSLLVTVLNYNDLPPVFQLSSYRSTVTESSTVFLIPVTVQASDPDGFAVTYSIVGGNTLNNAFRIDPNLGVLSLISQVNYKDTPGQNGFFNLNVSAADSGNPSQVSYVTITVEVRDENNANPTFPNTSYNKTISESVATGTTVLQVLATDTDSGTNGELTYSITVGAKDDFKIKSDTGIIYVGSSATLDYDDTAAYTIRVEAIDRGSPPRTGSTTVYITLEDANNKSPKFDIPLYVEKLDETEPVGTSVLRMNATDLDSARSIQYSIRLSTIIAYQANGQQVATIFDYNYRQAFRIDSTSGIIYTNATLDFDKASQIQFIVEARDVNATLEQTATATALIYILQDVDDTPEFDAPWTKANPSYNHVIPEAKSNFTYITLIAYVPSTKEQIRDFQEVPGTDTQDYFVVERTTGKVLANREIDYETLDRKILSLTVRATSPAGLSSIANINFQIQDINDNAPMFLQPNYTFTVSEGKQYPEEVGNIMAYDADSSSNANISFSITGTNSSHFTIFMVGNNMRSATGIIAVSQNTILDYETTQQYNLVLHARDNPDVSRFDVYKETSIKLTIRLTDINDQKPVFSQQTYNFFTVETFGGSNVIGQVSATDLDTGSNGRVTYNFVNATAIVSRYFQIFPNSGNVVTMTSLEGASVYGSFYVKVRARDSGTPFEFSYANVYINVSSGQLDNGQPIWFQPAIGAFVNILEHTAINTNIFNASASPRTQGAGILFSFLSNSQDLNKFAITPQGHITIIGDIDREEKAIYDLIILATDSLNSTLQGTRRLTVRVLDINDNLPSFRSCPDKTYLDVVTVSVRENLIAETFVYRVEACDLDVAPNNNIEYRFNYDDSSCFPNATSPFTLNSATGWITTNVALNRELVPMYRVCVEARPALFGRRKRATDDTVQKIDVIVLDNNDNGPVFLTKDIFKAIFELPTAEAVTQLRAVDPDSSFFNKVRYSITEILFEKPGRQIQTYGAFNINPDTGLVTVNFPTYNAFTSGYFKISVRAEDSFDSTMFDTTQIMILIAEEVSQIRVVTDSNDNLDIADNVAQMISDLNAAGLVTFQQTQIRYHKDSSGAAIPSKTDVCMLAIQNNKVLDAYDGQAMLETRDGIIRNYGFREIGSCEPSTTSDLEGWSVFWWVLVAFAIFMFILILILMYAIFALYRNYKSFMTTRQQYLVQ